MSDTQGSPLDFDRCWSGYIRPRLVKLMGGINTRNAIIGPMLLEQTERKLQAEWVGRPLFVRGVLAYFQRLHKIASSAPCISRHWLLTGVLF